LPRGPTDDIPAFELKFLVTPGQALAIEERARRLLVLDPHADPALGGAYETTTLYLDTSDRSILHRLAPARRRKHRLRRYGAAEAIFLERKTRWNDRVRKRRTAILQEELLLLPGPLSQPTWAAHWFQRQTQARRLEPTCLLTYERLAYVGLHAGQPMRLTFDRNLRGELARGWSVPPVEATEALLPDRVICELKFRLTLPPLFRDIVQEFQLMPGAVSKYRIFMQRSVASCLAHGAPGDA
jgi:hypothetical protein